MLARSNRLKMALIAATGALLGTSFYLAHLSGRAMSAAVGDTLKSSDLGFLSILAGMPAMLLGVALIVAEQNGALPLRVIKLVATFACWFILQTLACFLIQTFSAP